MTRPGTSDRSALGGHVALTFDDGPDPLGTPAVLDALAHAGARGTFYVLGERVVRHPGMLARMLDEGHAVQVHGHAHLRHPAAGRGAIAADLEAALAVLREHGVRPGWWRVPWGDLAGFTPFLATAAGLRLAGWTADTHDWRGDAPEAMLAAVSGALRPGAVVLAHDGIGPGAQRADGQATAALVGPVVAAVRAAGLEPAAMDDDWRTPLPAGNPAQRPPRVGAADADERTIAADFGYGRPR